MNLQLVRKSTGPQGTFGELYLIENGQPQKTFFTGELPWKDNQANISCIPAGTYECLWQFSPHFQTNKYHVQVPGRTDVMIHQGNFCGDTSQGLRSDVLGCILLGLNQDTLENQQAVLESALAVQSFENLMGGETFTLEVIERYAV